MPCAQERKKSFVWKKRPPLRPYAEQQEASYCVKHVSSFHINQACEQNVCAGRDKKRQAAQIWSLGYSSTPPPLSIHSPHFNCHCLPIATAHTVPIMTVPYNAAIALDLSFNDPPSVNLYCTAFLSHRSLSAPLACGRINWGEINWPQIFQAWPMRYVKHRVSHLRCWFDYWLIALYSSMCAISVKSLLATHMTVTFN